MQQAIEKAYKLPTHLVDCVSQIVLNLSVLGKHLHSLHGYEEFNSVPNVHTTVRITTFSIKDYFGKFSMKDT